jgi:hypothetical protein
MAQESEKEVENYFTSDKTKSFYVWINEKDIYANHNANMVGSFVSVSNKEDNLMFVPNKNFSGYISPFQGNLLRSYSAEYNLEIARKQNYSKYPSRLVATFLFEQEEDAIRYRDTHEFHVGSRSLKVGKTVGSYLYSRHDLSWIDFLRSPLLIDKDTAHKMVHSYWKGESVEDFKLELMEKPLSAVARSIYEVLFVGRIDF